VHRLGDAAAVLGLETIEEVWSEGQARAKSQTTSLGGKPTAEAGERRLVGCSLATARRIAREHLQEPRPVPRRRRVAELLYERRWQSVRGYARRRRRRTQRVSRGPRGKKHGPEIRLSVLTVTKLLKSEYSSSAGAAAAARSSCSQSSGPFITKLEPLRASSCGSSTAASGSVVGVAEVSICDIPR